jgi:hypothetical protein
MNISVVYSDGTENEFEIELCCYKCSRSKYNITKHQHDFLLKNRNSKIEVPDSVHSEGRFVNFISKI